MNVTETVSGKNVNGKLSQLRKARENPRKGAKHGQFEKWPAQLQKRANFSKTDQNLEKEIHEKEILMLDFEQMIDEMETELQNSLNTQTQLKRENEKLQTNIQNLTQKNDSLNRKLMVNQITRRGPNDSSRCSK